MDELAGKLFGDEDGETDGLFGVLGGVVDRPIGAPGGEEDTIW